MNQRWCPVTLRYIDSPMVSKDAPSPLRHYEATWFDVDALRRARGEASIESLSNVYAKCAALRDLEVATEALASVRGVREKYPHDDLPALDALVKQAEAEYERTLAQARAVVHAAVLRTFHVWLSVELQSLVGDRGVVIDVCEQRRVVAYCPYHVCVTLRYRDVNDPATLQARIILCVAHTAGSDAVTKTMRGLVNEALDDLRTAVLSKDAAVTSVAPAARRACKAIVVHEKGRADAVETDCKTHAHLVVTLRQTIDLAAP